MQTLKIKTLGFSALLLAASPLASWANDLSLPANGTGLRTPSSDPNSISNLSIAPNETEALLLGMEEVDVWGRIRAGFGIPDLDNHLVTNQTKWYSTRPDYMQRTTTRASRYLFHVVQELEKRNMPTELALLPFIESAFNPLAISSMKASGMWQFMPATGRDFNLQQNMFKDERRGVIASTDAALTYLQRLYGMFGDWQLALAAYNWGEGNVQRAVKKNQAAGLPTDFASLSPLMPDETRNYVPKLQAVKNIIAAPEQYGLTLPKVENQPYFITISKTRDIDIKVAAQLAEIPMEEFKALNPQFNKPVIIGSAKTQILLPQSNAEKFKANLAKWGRALSSWTAHTVTSARERIETIASRFGTTPAVLREVNNIPPKMRLKAGSTILVPKSEEMAEKDIPAELVEKATMMVEPDVPDTRRIYVKVGKRDTLASIAQRHNVSVAQVKSWNGLQRDSVNRGQSLQLHVPYQQTSTRTTTHVARAAPAPTRVKVHHSASSNPKARPVAKTAHQQRTRHPVKS